MDSSQEELNVRINLEKEDYQAAFNLCVDYFQEALFRKIYGMIGNKDDAKDVLQNCYISIWKGLPKFRMDSKVFSWCYRIASNEALMFLRKNKRLSDQEIPELHAEVDLNKSSDTILKELQEVLKDLNPAVAKTFKMKYFEGLKYAQIRELTGIAEGTLKSHYHQAVKKIKAHFMKDSTF